MTIIPASIPSNLITPIFQTNWPHKCTLLVSSHYENQPIALYIKKKNRKSCLHIIYNPHTQCIRAQWRERTRYKQANRTYKKKLNVRYRLGSVTIKLEIDLFIFTRLTPPPTYGNHSTWRSPLWFNLLYILENKQTRLLKQINHLIFFMFNKQCGDWIALGRHGSEVIYNFTKF